MIIKKTWIRCKENRYMFKDEYLYTGYFLLGIIPLYIKRELLKTTLKF